MVKNLENTAKHKEKKIHPYSTSRKQPRLIWEVCHLAGLAFLSALYLCLSMGISGSNTFLFVACSIIVCGEHFPMQQMLHRKCSQVFETPGGWGGSQH